ncbi:MAG: lysophospholipid acyltransferase family protein [Chloroflexota bacterium]|jgi:1-acyl-sn-glycerol-3-phosphate acyltransferase
MEPIHEINLVAEQTAIPELGPEIPRRGNALSRAIGRFIMRLFGWQVEGELPDTARLVLVGAPHTSNLDFFMTALTMLALGIDVKFVMKHTAFKGPVGTFLRWFGGIPLDRDRSRDFVSQMVDAFQERDELLLAIMPEGTRSVVSGWRSGFYYIALGANVPLVMVVFDYDNRRMHIGPTFIPSGDYETDLPIVQSFFAGVRGRKTERMLSLEIAAKLKEPVT